MISARWPHSNPLGGVAQGGLLIPVIGSAADVEGVVEQDDENVSGMSRSVR